MSPRVNEYPVKRTYSGTYNNVWNEFTYFEILLSSAHGDLGQAESNANWTPIATQRDYEQLKQKIEQRLGLSVMKNAI